MSIAAGDRLHEPARAHEAGLSVAVRRQGGVFYTPADVAERLLAVAAPAGALRPPRRPTICDPTCGGGAFLLAAADRLEQLGQPVQAIVEDLVWGADVDAAAVAVAGQGLREWAAARGVAAEPRHLVVADTLLRGSRAWPDAPPDGFDVVIGNPPFQSQLATGTARTPRRSAAVRRRLGAVAAPYADSAALFLVVACGLAAPEGRVAMILPESVLSTRDSGRARAEVLRSASLVGLWWPGEPVFDAGVQVCAPVLALGPTRVAGERPVRRWRGRGFVAAGTATHPDRARGDGASWSPLLASLRGTPTVSLTAPAGPDPLGDLSSLASATAGFRDQYYGVAPHVREADPPDPTEGDRDDRTTAGHITDDQTKAARTGSAAIRLVTAGLIDPMHCRWGEVTTRFAGRHWQAPEVDLDALRAADGRLAAWADARLVPKVVVATQTRLLEAAVDLDGCWWPSVPTIAVVPTSGDPADLWRIAAVLSAPPVSAWALERFGGAALSTDAVKLSASQVLSVPLPRDHGAWAEGASAARAAQAAGEQGDADGWAAALDRLGHAMTRAYGADDDVRRWWADRRPAWR